MQLAERTSRPVLGSEKCDVSTESAGGSPEAPEYTVYAVRDDQRSTLGKKKKNKRVSTQGKFFFSRQTRVGLR